jgi:hypothetical protein
MEILRAWPVDRVSIPSVFYNFLKPDCPQNLLQKLAHKQNRNENRLVTKTCTQTETETKIESIETFLEGKAK